MYRKIGILLTASLFILAGCRINTPPVITNFSASPASGYAPLQVTFRVSANDPDGDQITCNINFGDGNSIGPLPCSSTLNQSHAYDNSGIYTAILTVNDGRGGSAQKFVQISSLSEGACPTPSSSSYAQLSFRDSTTVSGIGRFDGVAYAPGELLVLRPSDAPAYSEQAASLEAELGLERMDPPAIAGWVHYRVPEGEEYVLAQHILETGLGSYVQPNYRYMALYTPDDPLYGSEQKIQYDLLQITQGWDLLPSSTSTFRPVVGVIDTGVADDHPDLDEHVQAGEDFSDGDSDPYPNPDYDHGTMVASIVAAETNNNQGMAGVTNNLVDIMPLKVFPNAYSTTIADAIDWASQNGAHVLNLSLCIQDSNGFCADMTSSPDLVIETALESAYNVGIVSFAASGNYDDPWIGYPASSQYTIAVGATDNSSPPHRADPNDWDEGYGSNCGPELDIVAPGTLVLGAGIPSASDPEPYLQGSGTSFSTPYAAGVAALYIYQYHAEKNALPDPDQVLSCLRSSAEDLQDPGFDYATGAGLVRADRVLDTVSNLYGCY
ncbi:S8 family serine peptidase [Oceanithermus sp.]